MSSRPTPMAGRRRSGRPTWGRSRRDRDADDRLSGPSQAPLAAALQDAPARPDRTARSSASPITTRCSTSTSAMAPAASATGPTSGMQISNIQTGTGLDAGNFEVTFPIAESPRPITRAAVARRPLPPLRGAAVRSRLEQPAPARASSCSATAANGGSKATRRSPRSATSATGSTRRSAAAAEPVRRRLCRPGPVLRHADGDRRHGDGGHRRDAFHGVVHRTYADGFFDRGKVSFTSGGNAGTGRCRSGAGPPPA
jgi:hypothetical protein